MEGGFIFKWGVYPMEGISVDGGVTPPYPPPHYGKPYPTLG